MIQILCCFVIRVGQMGQQDIHRTDGSKSSILSNITVSFPEIRFTDIQAYMVGSPAKDYSDIPIPSNSAIGKNRRWNLFRWLSNDQSVFTHNAPPFRYFLSRKMFSYVYQDLP